MVKDRKSVAVHLPGVGDVTAEGIQEEISGEGIIDSFLSGNPAYASRRAEEVPDEEDEEEEAPLMSKFEGYRLIPQLLDGTDKVRHEDDITYIARFAIERGRVTSEKELGDWINKQLAFADQSGFVEKPNNKLPPIPAVIPLAKYLRSIETAARP